MKYILLAMNRVLMLTALNVVHMMNVTMASASTAAMKRTQELLLTMRNTSSGAIDEYMA
jgi:hypothetical protein